MKDHGPFPVTIMPNNITTLKEANNNEAHQTKLSFFFFEKKKNHVLRGNRNIVKT